MAKPLPYPMIGLRVPAGALRRLQALAKRQGVTLSELLRTAALDLLDP